MGIKIQDSMKKLTYVLNHYSEEEASHFVHVLYLIERMAGKGCKITLLIEKADKLPVFENDNVKVMRPFTKLPLLRHLEMFVRIIFLILSGYKRTFVRIAAPAAIVASLAHRICGGRSYLWQSGTAYEHDMAQPRSIKKLRWWLVSYLPNTLARKLTHRFVTGPESMVDYYVDVVGVPRNKIDLLYNDVQIDRFDRVLHPEDRRDFCSKNRVSEDALILLLVHRLSPVRRTLMYLEPFLKRVAADLSGTEWVLVVVGGGSELQSAKGMVSTLGMEQHVVFLGDVPNLEVPGLYAVGDIFVHPTYTEGFPRVLIEAMAAGLPIVSTDAGGTFQLFGARQKCYIVDKRDPDGFAEKAIDLILNKGAWAELSEENRNVVQRFSTEAVSDMYIRVLFS